MVRVVQAYLRIGISLDLREQMSRRILMEVGQAAAARPRWRILLDGFELNTPAELAACDLLVVRSRSHPALRSAAVRQRTVLLTGHPLPGMRSVWCDDAAVGRLAATHLLARGYRQVAMRDDHRLPSLRRRLEACQAVVAAAGAVFHRIPHMRSRGRWTLEQESRHFRAALARLPRPLGLIGFDASTTRRHAADVVASGWDIPGEVGLVACGDDPLLTDSGHPSLTAIDLDEVRIGREIVRALDDIIAGRSFAGPIWVPPARVITRASTGGRHSLLTQALAAWAKNPHMAEDLDVLAAAVGVSRRSLERHWRAHFGHGPAADRTRRRLDQACVLLRDPALSVTAIASRCGFASRGSFSHVFCRVFGVAPVTWRRTAAGTTDRAR